MIGPCGERVGLFVEPHFGGRRRRACARARWVCGTLGWGTALRGGRLRVRGGCLRAVVGEAGRAHPGCAVTAMAVRLPPGLGETRSLRSPFILPGG